MTLLLAVSGAGCGSDDEGEPAIRAHLRQFEASSETTVEGFAALAEQCARLGEAMQAEDWTTFDDALLRQAEVLAWLNPAISDLEAAERGIQAALAGAPAPSPAADTGSSSSGFLRTIGRMWGYTNTLMTGNDEASRLREIMYDPNSTWEESEAARRQIWNLGMGVGDSMALTTTGTMVGMGAGGLATSTAGKLIASTGSRVIYQKGMTAITGSSSCESTDPEVPCTVILDRTAEDGSVMAPTGSSSTGISGDGMARVRADGVETSETEPGELSRDLIPIDEATEENVTRGDEADPVVAAAWLICQRDSSMTTYYGCVEVPGGYGEWIAMSSAQKNELCQSDGYEQFAGEHVEGVVADAEASCRDNCGDLDAAGQYYECDTPP